MYDKIHGHTKYSFQRYPHDHVGTETLSRLIGTNTQQSSKWIINKTHILLSLVNAHS